MDLNLLGNSNEHFMECGIIKGTICDIVIVGSLGAIMYLITEGLISRTAGLGHVYRFVGNNIFYFHIIFMLQLNHNLHLPNQIMLISLLNHELTDALSPSKY